MFDFGKLVLLYRRQQKIYEWSQDSQWFILSTKTFLWKWKKQTDSFNIENLVTLWWVQQVLCWQSPT